VHSYYAQIRSLLRDRPDLRPSLKRCRHCRIFFFTDPRNAGREDLRCGFGCRQAHRRACSTRRSVGFYREHPDKKRHQNRKRYLLTAPPCRDGGAEPKEERPAPMVCHVRVIVSLIEGRRVGLHEIVEMLAKKGRQHRMVRARRPAYDVRRIRDRGS
jgi:hypothetical protein